MRHATVAFFLALSPVTALHAQSMPVATFLAKADALGKKGAMALFSGDIGRLKAEVQNSGKAIRAEQEAAREAGRPAVTCLPEKASVTSAELIAHFRSIPPARRAMPVKAAFAGLVAKKYPCPVRT